MLYIFNGNSEFTHLLVCIDFPEETYRKSGNAQYADPYGSDEETILITEYQVDTYNINDNKLIKFAIINEYVYKGTAGFDFIWVSDMKIANSNPFKFGRLKD